MGCVCKINIRFINHNDRIAMFLKEFFDIRQRQKYPSWRIGIGNNNATARAAIVIDINAKIGFERNGHQIHVESIGIHRIKTITNIRG